MIPGWTMRGSFIRAQRTILYTIGDRKLVQPGPVEPFRIKRRTTVDGPNFPEFLRVRLIQIMDNFVINGNPATIFGRTVHGTTGTHGFDKNPMHWHHGCSNGCLKPAG